MTPSLLALWIILLSGAFWVRTPSVLGVAALTGAVLVLSWELRRGTVTRRRRAIAALMGWALVALTAQPLFVNRAASERRGGGAVAPSAPGGALRTAVAAEGERLVAAARRATRLSRDRATAFREIGGLLPSEVDRAVIVAQAGRPFAWSGRLVVPLDSLRGSVGAIVTPFYVVLYAAHLDGDRLGESAREFRLPPGTLAGDEDIAHQVWFLLRFRTEGPMGRLAPRAVERQQVVLSPSGSELLRFGTVDVAAQRWVIRAGDLVVQEVWTDSRGRLLRVRFPTLDLDAVRDDIPR
ncbi:MAG: hypothetical protein ACKORK_11785 [Gemmatimonadota bacterium]